ncbi:glycosyltransferase family 2 protein [Salegentibacter sp. F188]|uniref:Glycosyltransferase family 2 protein n=1 Tax=Autumnicola patrickiae TaxID=3075591 RepID=A0ABU3E1H7_9FLAO|nr:glycosyltransferase family 2 protein [Salegentibacter sp. F188]MDT0689805.1 glycosyltransferase family 2 protein [Salegentibacter sp. F188]
MKNDLTEFKVSVIIPVYNAGPFVAKAVQSAVDLPEVGEIILVEDNSPDNALEVCRELEAKYEKIKLLRHPGGDNRGVSASRNLGIENSRFSYIAFLDADDWYLPERFKKDKISFANSHDVDAVYSFSVLEENHERTHKNQKTKPDIREEIGNAGIKEFYKYALEKRWPDFHTNSITLKKEFLVKDKLFDERLRLHEDSELWKRLIRRGKFMPGEILHPVTIIRRHDKNTITSRTLNSRLKMHAVFIDNIGIENLYGFEKKHSIRDIARTKSRTKSNNWARRFFFRLNLIKAKTGSNKFLREFVVANLK